MKVRYNTAVGIVFVVLGAVCTILGLWLAMLGEFNPSVLVGLLVLLLGILYLVRPYFWVHANSVEVPAVIGPARRRFEFQTLTMDGNKVIAVRADGTRKKVPVTRWMSNTSDWDTVMSGRTTPAGP
jgi:hypothetical protein